MKDSTRVFVIALAFALLAFAGAPAVLIGNISLSAFLILECCFCMPILLCLGALVSAWERMEHDVLTPIRVHSFRKQIPKGRE